MAAVVLGSICWFVVPNLFCLFTSAMQDFFQISVQRQAANAAAQTSGENFPSDSAGVFTT